MNPDRSVKALASTEVDVSSLEPGKSIRGYGNEAHKTVSRQGGFSFSTGAVVSSATGINPFIITAPPQESSL